MISRCSGARRSLTCGVCVRLCVCVCARARVCACVASVQARNCVGVRIPHTATLGRSGEDFLRYDGGDSGGGGGALETFFSVAYATIFMKPCFDRLSVSVASPRMRGREHPRAGACDFAHMPARVCVRAGARTRCMCASARMRVRMMRTHDAYA
jgi:hypothetical protein